MKRNYACMFAIVLMVAMFAITPALVPVMAQPAVTAPVYEVKAGDNLWELAAAKRNDPLLWKDVVRQNPFLNESGRQFERNGKLVVLLHPGEKLLGLEKLGIVPNPIPFSQLQLAPQPVQSAPVLVREAWYQNPWLWLAIAAVLLTGLWLLRRMLNADPATARPPIVPGGVNNPEQATERFREAARNEYARQTGAPVQNVQNFTVQGLTPGRIWGVLNVRYQDGREVPRRLNGERAYRASVQFPGRQQPEQLYMLQACGNDLRYGGISRYLPGPDFRFEEDVVVPIAATAAPAPAAAPAKQPRVMAAAAGNGGDGESDLTSDPPPADPAPQQEPPAPAVPQESVTTRPTARSAGNGGATQKRQRKFFTFNPSDETQPNRVAFNGYSTFRVETTEDGETTVRFK